MHVNHLSYCLVQDKSSTNHSCDGYLLSLLSNTLFSSNSTALCPRRMTHRMSHCVLMLSGSRLGSLTRGDQKEGGELGWGIYFPGSSLKNCSGLAAPSMKGHGSCQVVHASQPSFLPLLLQTWGMVSAPTVSSLGVLLFINYVYTFCEQLPFYFFLIES